MVRDRGCECSIPSQSASFSPTCSLPLPRQKINPFVFKQFHAHLQKLQRSGSAPLSSRPSSSDDYCVPVMVHEPRRPIAANRPWCNNWQGTRILPHPGKQLRGPRCLRILSGHRELFDAVPGYTPARSGSQVVPGSIVQTMDRSRVA